MKTRLLVLLILLCEYSVLISQVPQGFNYQAIARDVNGGIITDQLLPVRITIQTEQTGGTLIWAEQHTVTTNQFGLISFILGTGSRLDGTVTFFKDVVWGAQPMFLKTEVKYPGPAWSEMGTTQIWSVPYSLVSGNVAGSLEKLAVTGVTSNMDEALFEVKNKDNQTVFAVYNEGVRIYVDNGTKGSKGGFAIGGFGDTKAVSQDLFVVSTDSIRAYIYDDPAVKASKGGFAIGGFDLSKGATNDYLHISPDSVRVYVDDDPNSKGSKGGFAIGGFDLSKGLNQKYLTVNTDSIRMYIDDTPDKGSKGGFAIGGFDLSKGGSNSFLNVATDASGIINPSENRILWYPLADKNAFFVGRVLIEKPDSVGINSVTTGYESRARGDFSQAFGYKSIARGSYSTAIGKQAVAHRDNSFAFGENAYAGGTGSFALGIGSIASGLGSFALGFEGRDSTNNLTGATKSTGTYSMAFGMGARSSNIGSLAMGTMAEATSEYSTAIGYQTKAQNWYATAIGYKTRATGLFSSAFGYGSLASGESSVALGKASAGGKLSLAVGSSYAGGTYSMAFGNSSVSFGYSALAAGYENSAVGNYSAAFGSGTFSNGQNSFASGYATIAEADYVNVSGLWNIGFKVLPTMDITDPQYNPLFELGNGTGSSRTNALTVLHNGQMLVGTHDGAFIEEQILYNDPPHTLYIKGRKPWVSEGYFGLYVQGISTYEGDLMPSTVNTYSLGELTTPWKAIYSAGYYGQSGNATFYSNIIPSGVKYLGSSGARWNSAYIETYYGNSSNIATFVSTIIPSGTRDLGSSAARWNNIFANTYYGNSSSNAVFASSILPSGTRNLGSTSAYWSNIYSSGLTLNGSTGLTELVFTQSGLYKGAIGFSNTSGYIYIYQGDNFSFKAGKFGIGNTDPGQKLDITGGYGRVGSGYSWLTNSDIRYKKNITTLTNSLQKIVNLRGVRFDLIEDTNSVEGSGKYIGFIAQELEKMFPEFVVTEDSGYKSVAYDKISAVLVEAVKEQQKQIESQDLKIERLEMLLEQVLASGVIK